MTEDHWCSESSQIPPIDGHPEMEDYNDGDKLLTIELSGYYYDMLIKKAIQKKMEELFSEPSSYEDDDDSCLSR